MNQKALEIRDHVVSEMEAGNAFSFKPGVTIAEMIGTGDVPQEFLETVTYNLEDGRNSVDLLYKDIYATTESRDLSEVVIRRTLGNSSVVFLRKLTGGEVVFGDLAGGEETMVRLNTWSAGLEYDEDFVEYNKLYDVARLARTMGLSYNKLLNHLHLGPFMAATFTTTTGDAATKRAAQDAGTAQLIPYQGNIADTFRLAFQVLPAGSIVLHNSVDTYAMQNAIAADNLDDNVTPSVTKTKLQQAKFIAYDGTTITMGGRKYAYPGVAPGTCYVIVPKLNFEELVKHDLITDSNMGDFSRLILTQLIARARRGVFAVPGGEDGAIKLALA